MTKNNRPCQYAARSRSIFSSFTRAWVDVRFAFILRTPFFSCRCSFSYPRLCLEKNAWNALPPTRRGPTLEDDQVGTSSLLESRLSQCLRQLFVPGSPLLQLYRPPSTATGGCNSVGLLLFGLLHISYSIGQGSMVADRWKTSVKDVRYHCLTQPKSSAHFSTLHLASHDVPCQQSSRSNAGK